LDLAVTPCAEQPLDLCRAFLSLGIGMIAMLIVAALQRAVSSFRDRSRKEQEWEEMEH
jgi:hypothetical protein